MQSCLYLNNESNQIPQPHCCSAAPQHPGQGCSKGRQVPNTPQVPPAAGSSSPCPEVQSTHTHPKDKASKGSITDPHAPNLQVIQFYAHIFIFTSICWYSFLAKYCTANAELAVTSQSEINPTKNWKLSLPSLHVFCYYNLESMLYPWHYQAEIQDIQLYGTKNP